MTGGRQHNVSSFLELATARPVAPKASARAFTVFVECLLSVCARLFITSEESKNLSPRALLTNREKSAGSPRDDDLDPSFELPVDRLPVGVVPLPGKQYFEKGLREYIRQGACQG